MMNEINEVESKHILTAEDLSNLFINTKGRSFLTEVWEKIPKVLRQFKVCDEGRPRRDTGRGDEG